MIRILIILSFISLSLTGCGKKAEAAAAAATATNKEEEKSIEENTIKGTLTEGRIIGTYIKGEHEGDYIAIYNDFPRNAEVRVLIDSVVHNETIRPQHCLLVDKTYIGSIEITTTNRVGGVELICDETVSRSCGGSSVSLEVNTRRFPVMRYLEEIPKKCLTNRTSIVRKNEIF